MLYSGAKLVKITESADVYPLFLDFICYIWTYCVNLTVALRTLAGFFLNSVYDGQNDML